MKTKIKIKRAYIQAACDIFQVDTIQDQILNSKQVSTLINLNVFNKWCINSLTDMDGIEVGDYVKCINHPTIDYFGSGWRLNYVFQVTRMNDLMNDNGMMYFGGINGNGVTGYGLRPATAREIEEVLNLPF